MTILRTILLAVMAMAISSPLAAAETRTMTLDKFSKIKVSTRADLDISVGRPRAFSMEGRAEDLAKLVIRVQGDMLIIKKEKYSGTMKKISISGSGDATVYASETIHIRTSGSSDVNVYGNPKSIQNRSSGSSDLVVHDDK